MKVGGRRETVHIQPGQGEQANRRILCISQNSQEQKTRESGQEEQEGTEDKMNPGMENSQEQKKEGSSQWRAARNRRRDGSGHGEQSGTEEKKDEASKEQLGTEDKRIRARRTVWNKRKEGLGQ